MTDDTSTERTRHRGARAVDRRGRRRAPTRRRRRRGAPTPAAAASGLVRPPPLDRADADRRHRHRHPPPGRVPGSRAADGGGVHARVPRAAARGRHPQPRLPPPLRPGQHLDHRRLLQGVRRVDVDRAGGRASSSSCRSSRASPTSATAGAATSPPCRGVVTAIVIIPPIGVTALAWVGGIALALWSVAVATRALDPGRNRARGLLVAGLLAGAALLFRPDLVLCLGLSLGVLFLFAPRRAGPQAPGARRRHRRQPLPGAPRPRRARQRRPGHGPRAGVRAAARALACRSRRRTTSTRASSTGPSPFREFPWPLPAPSSRCRSRCSSARCSAWRPCWW